MAAVLQGKLSNYDTDLFRPLIARVETLCGKTYGAGRGRRRLDAGHRRPRARGHLPDRRRGDARPTSGAATCCGGSCGGPCATGGCSGLEAPFLWDVTGSVVAVMGDAYPEIREAQARVAETVRQEEERFAETLDLGMARIKE